MMRGALILAGLMLASPAWSAELETEPLDAAFLEYLANLEGDDADWTLLAEAASKAPTQTDSEASSETSRTGKPSKEAAKPAEEEP